MPIVQTVTFQDFVDAFRARGRDTQFTYDAKRALFDWLEQYSEDTGTPVELDVIALCCEFCECSYDDAIRDYNIDVSEYAPHDEQARKDAVIDYLQDNTMLVWYDDETVLFQCF